MAARKHALAAAELKLDTVEKRLEQLGQEQTIKLSQAEQELARQRKSWDLKVQRAEGNLQALKQKLDLSTLKAPIKGTILEVFQHVGETAGASPILTMADLENMYVVAEVFQGDLLTLSPGIRATITSDALPEPLTGKVETIGKLISTQSRTAEVRIRLDDSRLASKLIALEVDISIEL
jgi:HlyD family secretion protein